MNITKSVLALVFTTALFIGCKDTEKSPEQFAENSEAVAAKVETANFKIEGMSCAMGCARTIESKLAGIDGVIKASVDFEMKTGMVKYDSAKLTPEKITKAVEAVAGGDTYKVTNMKSSQDQASLYNKDKKKKKRSKSDDKKTDDKKEGCATEAKAGGCCAGKKAVSCHTDKSAM